MNFLLLVPKLLIAGGSSFLGSLELPTNPVIMDHTLPGEQIASPKVVCRDRWGTPMPPNGKGGYTLIAPVKNGLVEQSLWVPPLFGTRPSSVVSELARPVPQVVTPPPGGLPH